METTTKCWMLLRLGADEVDDEVAGLQAAAASSPAAEIANVT